MISFIRLRPGFQTRLLEQVKPLGGRMSDVREEAKIPMASRLRPSYSRAECVCEKKHKKEASFSANTQRAFRTTCGSVKTNYVSVNINDSILSNIEHPDYSKPNHIVHTSIR